MSKSGFVDTCLLPSVSCGCPKIPLCAGPKHLAFVENGIDMVDEETLETAKRRLVEAFDPQKIILFGSYARGTADPHSDVDILVVCPVKGSRRALMTAMDRALRGLGFARDIVILSPEEFERDRHIPGTVARPAYREGRILYERH